MPTPQLIGTFDPADGEPAYFTVDEARGRLYGTYFSDGLRRFTYPGLVNIDGAGASWFVNPGTEVDGVAVRPSDGDVIIAERGTGVGDGRTYYRIDSGSGVSFTVASEAGTPGQFPPETLLTWHPGDSTVYGLLGSNPVRLIEVDLAGSSVVDPVALFTGMNFAGIPHVTPDGAIWFIATRTTAPTEVVARYDGSLTYAAADLQNYGFARCDDSFFLADYSEDWFAWDPALTQSGVSLSLDAGSGSSFTAPGAVAAWSIDTQLWKIQCRGPWTVGRVAWGNRGAWH